MKPLALNPFRQVRRRAATHGRSSRTQRGAFLIEGMIAIAIFSIGISALLGIVGKMVVGSADAQYRVQAAQFASSIIAEMRVADPTTLATVYDPIAPGPGFTKWNNLIIGQLPLAGASTSKPLMILLNTTGTAPVATVTIAWRAAPEKTVDASNNGVPHTYVTSTYLN
jgi:type IV pilus assembly protein PilV